MSCHEQMRRDLTARGGFCYSYVFRWAKEKVTVFFLISYPFLHATTELFYQTVPKLCSYISVKKRLGSAYFYGTRTATSMCYSYGSQKILMNFCVLLVISVWEWVLAGGGKHSGNLIENWAAVEHFFNLWEGRGRMSRGGSRVLGKGAITVE